MNAQRPVNLRFPVILLTAFLLIWGVILARNFLYPLTFGLLFSYLLYPPANFLEKNRVPRILAILISILGALIIVAAIFFVFYKQLTSLFEDFASLKRSANNNIESLQNNLEAWLGLQDNRIEQFLKTQVNQFFGAGNTGLQQIFSATTGTIFRILILPVYIFLFLFYRTKFAYFILKIVPKGRQFDTIRILRDISTIAARYMGGVAIVVLILCVINSTGLLIIGVRYAILFGIISAFFNFIPYFGTLMGGAVPLLFVLLTTDDPLHYGIRVVILFIIVQFTENNILTPNIVGGHVKVNPFFIIVGLVLGAAVWGIPGMLIIVPFFAILRIIFKHIEPYKPLSYLLGPKGTRKHSIHMSKIRRLLHLRKREDKLSNQD